MCIPSGMAGSWNTNAVNWKKKVEESQTVRCRLLSKSHSLQEALDFARAQVLSDKQANWIEMEQQLGVTNPKK